MAEISNADSNDFRFQIREIKRFAIYDYKDNKKDKFLCEYLLKNKQNFWDFLHYLIVKKEPKA